MKKIIVLLCLVILTAFLFGCNNADEYTSEELVKELRLLKNNKNNFEDKTIFIDANDSILKKIKEMNMMEFQEFATSYKSIHFEKYTFILFEDDIFIIAKCSDDYLKIIDVKIMSNITPTEMIKTQLVKGQSLDEVVSIAGYPYMATISSENSLSFKLANEEIIKVVFDENMYSLDVIHIDFESIKNPSYVINEKCESNNEKLEIDKALDISKNMSFEEVIELIGKPQRAFGSGAIWYEWDLEENKLLQVMFTRKSAYDEELFVVKYYIK